MNKHSENDQDVEYSTTVKTGNGSDQSNDDVVSDPALDDRVGNDWADEGGATPVGPATSTAADDVDVDEEEEGSEG
ncbi:hypothetical protein [Gulosibacter sediminis]|uniref:hypothetical protein n=1 Tax=Gulosibacter sediminis TaxID=1729695 RepID=UPI0024AE46EA|nr:hypothetical protein [Gulosibacter sediminis]